MQALVVTGGISTVGQELAAVESMIFLFEGVPYPPMKMDRSQKKGVTKKAFRKQLILKDAILVV
jgi:hypothetical protein